MTALQDFEVDSIGQRMGGMLDWIWTASPRSTVILSTLVVNCDPQAESRVLRANRQFQDLAKRQSAEQKRVVLVDMHGSDGPQLSDIADGTHPNDSGYYKMAKIWYNGIQEAASRGILLEPAERMMVSRV